MDDSRIIAQPLNRGTGVAVALALLHVLQRDADAVVVFVHVITTTPTLRHSAELSGLLYLAPSNTEIRVSEACPAQVQALLGTSRQGVKGLRQHQPDMNPRRVLHFLCVLSASLRIIRLASSILMSI